MARVLDAPGAAPASPVVVRALAGRRSLFFSLVLATMTGLLATLTTILGGNGLSVVDILMIVAVGLTLPWTVIGFWNAVIGFLILRLTRDPLALVAPLDGLAPSRDTPVTRNAIVVPVYNEDPNLVLRHLEATIDDLERTGGLEGFEIFLLSDTQLPELIAAEQEAVAAFRHSCRYNGRFHYRRRLKNTAYKTGNLWEFIDRHGDRFDHMLVLDADSVMSGPAIRRLVRGMEANPRLGILQSLITALPTESAFARMFQFGMRHGMRSYTTGSAWWQGPHGPYWGHNAIVRLSAFRAHCRLPDLPGRAPWGGLVLSHDMVEAVLMQRAGYEVRVLPDEFGSHELNPPCLPEFVRRSLRWCQGNLQYVRLVGQPGWHPMGRLQLVLAILMYVQAPAWLAFLTFGFLQGVFGLTGGTIAADPWAAPPLALGIGLFVTMMLMTFAPKIAGVADALCDAARRRSYGGPLPLLSAGLAEIIHGMLLAPIMALSETFFIGKLLTGRGLAWKAQARNGRGVPILEAAYRFWPQTLGGVVMFGAFALWAPGLILWIVPVVVGPLLAIPFAWLTTRRWLGRALADLQFAAVPEELAPPPEVRAAVPWVAHRPSSAHGAARLAHATAAVASASDRQL